MLSILTLSFRTIYYLQLIKSGLFNGPNKTVKIYKQMIHPNLKTLDRRVSSAIDKMFLKNKPQNYKIQNKFKSLLK